jgi:hypothetical protein
LRGARRQVRAKIILTNAGDAWVELVQAPKDERSITDLATLCVLYGPKMVFNAGECWSARWFVGAVGMFLKGRTHSAVQTPDDLADRLLRNGSGALLTERPQGDEILGAVTADLYRNASGVPTIQTYFPHTVGPEQCVASIRFLWAWTVLHLGETAIDRLWIAFALLPHYEETHADANGHVWEYTGFLAWASYSANMLATPFGQTFDPDCFLDPEPAVRGQGDMADVHHAVGGDVS